MLANTKRTRFLLGLARRSFVVTASLQERTIVAYALGILMAGVALAFRIWVGDALVGFPFLTFFLAVAISSFFFGWRAGLSCALAGGLLSWKYLIQTDETIVITAPSSLIALGFYTFTTGLFVVLTAAMQTSFAAYDKLTGELEERVKMRTSELEESNAKLVSEILGRSQAESQVRQLQKMESLGRLTGGMAHDFNNMLAVIIGSLNLLRRRLAKGDTDLERFIDAAVDGSQRAASLTQRLLAFSRQQPLAPEALDANRLVANMSDILNRTLGDEIGVETVLAAGLWRAQADPHQLESCLLNLAVNAKDAMPNGGKLTVETGNAHVDEAYARENEIAAGQYVLIAVTDTGSGMPADIAAKAFDPFFTTKAVGQGTGLGLSQVYGFTRQSRGHVKIYSEVDVGTTVKIYLPRTEDGGATEVPVISGSKAELPTGSPDVFILVVEDDARVRNFSSEALRELGYTVVEAASGSAALKIIEAGQRVDLLFTDVVMPEMTGRQLADIAVEKLPALKVLYTTGYTRNAVVHNGTLDPATQLLQKPFTLEALAVKVKQVTSG
jgi:signal transduction histidine kinase/CheY-like chemotaxis protein